MARFLRWIARETLLFFACFALLPFALVLLVVLWPIVEVMEAYDDAKRRGDA